MSDVAFQYRLPLTYVRVTGTRTAASSSLPAGPSVTGGTRTTFKLTTTTEVAADLLSSYTVTLSRESLAAQKSTWTLTGDSRLTGAERSITVQPFAGLGAAIKAGSVVAGIAGPALLAAGPPGWAALAGLTTIAAAGTSLAVQARTVIEQDDGELAVPISDPGVDPTKYGVHPGYLRQDELQARTLANLRATLVSATERHARTVLALAGAAEPDEAKALLSQVRMLERVLASATTGLARAEAQYAAWLESHTKTETTVVDHRLRIDLVPNETTLKAWASAAPDKFYSEWESLIRDLGMAVSFDFDQHVQDRDIKRLQEMRVQLEPEVVKYRPPRQGILRVWRATPTADGTQTDLELVETQRLLVAAPGNEQTIAISTGHESSNAVTLGFDDFGALTKVSTELKDPVLERAEGVSGMLTALSEGVTLGKDLREAVSPPSLVDQAAEAKAAAELGLTKAPVDPLKEQRDQLELAQLQAQLKLAEQLQSATSPPIVVALSTIG